MGRGTRRDRRSVTFTANCFIADPSSSETLDTSGKRKRGRERERGGLLRRTLGNAVACCRSRARHGQRGECGEREGETGGAEDIHLSAPLCLALPVPFPSFPPLCLRRRRTMKPYTAAHCSRGKNSERGGRSECEERKAKAPPPSPPKGELPC